MRRTHSGGDDNPMPSHGKTVSQWRSLDYGKGPDGPTAPWYGRSPSSPGMVKLHDQNAGDLEWTIGRYGWARTIGLRSRDRGALKAGQSSDGGTAHAAIVPDV